MADTVSNVIDQNWSWSSTNLRIKDPKKSVPYYRDHFGMTLIDVLDYPEHKCTKYFMLTLPKGESYTFTPGSKEARKYMCSVKGTALELTYTYGTESNDSKYHPGNAKNDGFGHVAFNVADVYEGCKVLVEKGVKFKKLPDEGRMKGLAFAYDPDGYWVEIVKRADEGCDWTGYNFSQTMLRVKDPQKSLAFYRDLIGLPLLSQKDLGVGTDWGFSLFFLGHAANGSTVRPGLQFDPCLELTHNHGTETDESFAYLNGNAPSDRVGFGHISFLVDDVTKVSKAFEESKTYNIVTKLGNGLPGVMVVQDPDGYFVQIASRNDSKLIDLALNGKKDVYGSEMWA